MNDEDTMTTSNCENENPNEFVSVSYPPSHPNKPDHGYLFGLKNLINIFENIYSEVATSI